MPLQHLARLRLHQQQISNKIFTDPAALAGWFGAMQAQDYTNVRWALGVRLPTATDAAVAAAIDAGKIIRTHILRPTWHLVAAEDIRWMLDLSGPRVSAQIAGMHQRLGLPTGVFKQSRAVIEKSLIGGVSLTRTELVTELEKSGINANLLQATQLMMQAELDGLICNGPMRGKQFTYSLLEERAPNARRLARDEAVATLVRRYFQSHGPATISDFVWWSGLTGADAKAGLEAIKADFISETIGAHTYWMHSNIPALNPSLTEVHLLPSYDEFIVSYKNRDASLDPAHKNIAILGNGIFKPIVVLNGKVVGIWQRILKRQYVLVEITLFNTLSPVEKQAVEAKAALFAQFMELELVVQFIP